MSLYSHYVPLHSSVMGEKVGRTASEMSVTNLAGENCIRLPMYPMTDAEIDYTCNSIHEALVSISSSKFKKAA